MKYLNCLLTWTMIALTLAAIQSLAQSTYEPYTFITLAGGGGATNAERRGTAIRFTGPAGVAANSAGTVYVADTFNNVIRRVTPAGLVTTLAGLPGSFGSVDGTGSEARFNYPDKLCVDATGNVYVADSGNSTIRKVTPQGIVTTLAGKAGSFASANGLGSEARFSGPEGVTSDNVGNLYVVDGGNCTIRKVSLAGTNWVVTTIAGRAGSVGSVDGMGSAARFNSPQGVAIDGAGNLFVGDTDNYTVRKIAPVGTNWMVTTVAGRAGSRGAVDGTNGAARLSDPKGVAVDGAGNIYVADTFNNAIRKLALQGTNWVVTTLGGRPGYYGNADGSGSVARFSNPDGVTVDGAGNLYVADFYSSTIRIGYPAPRLVPAGSGWGFSGERFGFLLTGPADRSVVVEASTDLVSWQPLWTNALTGALHFSDPQSGIFSNRFYRTRLP
jgi:sugar lactone lactonase YvrE